MKTHSWHPVPLLLYSKRSLVDEVQEFNEVQCIRGGLGRMHGTALMPLLLAHAGKLGKFGA